MCMRLKRCALGARASPCHVTLTMFFVLCVHVFVQHDGKPYCDVPCYGALFGPRGFGRGGVESHNAFGGGFDESMKKDMEQLEEYVCTRWC